MPRKPLTTLAARVRVVTSHHMKSVPRFPWFQQSGPLWRRCKRHWSTTWPAELQRKATAIKALMNYCDIEEPPAMSNKMLAEKSPSTNSSGDRAPTRSSRKSTRVQSFGARKPQSDPNQKVFRLRCESPHTPSRRSNSQCAYPEVLQ